MKKLLLMAIAAATLGLVVVSCNKNEGLITDDALIRDIALAENRLTVAPADLPVEISDYIGKNEFDTYVEEAFKAPESGYELTLGTGENLYFDLQGNILEFRGPGGGNFGPDGPHGPCFIRGRGFGRPVAVEDLPAVVVDYIAANYPDNTIQRAKARNGNLFVKLDGPTVLLFDSEGNFVEEVSPIRHCRECRPVRADNLPAPIAEYIATNYPDAEFKGACSRNGRVAVYLINDGGRQILVFDLDGNLLFHRP